MYSKPTFIRDDFISRFTWKTSLRRLFFVTKSIQTLVVTTTMRKGLVHGEKYLGQRGSLEPRENFSQVNLSWFTEISAMYC